ncbi:MAG: carbamoyltransferase HypF, partial [Candidatus Krumholzibacteriota bacterium]|nr:carbamoyltransferase HypF [Candidatus Krumholzibacteriota bacterium]
QILEIEPAPLIEAILRDLREGIPAGEIAAAFHHSIARMVVELSARWARKCGCPAVVISGGVFQNRVLYERVMKLSGEREYRLYHHRIVPPNDGGISLGQVEAAAAMLEKGMI